MGVRVGTASHIKTWWSVEDFDYTVNALDICYKCNTGGHVRRDCPSRIQARLTYSKEEFNYTVNTLGHCWECNYAGRVRIKCPDLGQSRAGYKRGQDKDVCCYYCNKYRHCSRDCLLPNRMRKDQEPVPPEDEFRKICMKVITENVKPRENHLLHT